MDYWKERCRLTEEVVHISNQILVDQSQIDQKVEDLEEFIKSNKIPNEDYLFSEMFESGYQSAKNGGYKVNGTYYEDLKLALERIKTVQNG